MTKCTSFVAGILFLALVSVQSATVTTTADNGPGSLREAISNAAPGEVISFGVTGAITLTNGELVIDQDLLIVGLGAANLVVERAPTAPPFRIFNVLAGTVGISSLSVRGGDAAAGGGINNEDTLALTNVVVVANVAGSGGGGGINNNGTLEIIGSQVLSNRVNGASLGGAGINSAGAVFAQDTAIRENVVNGPSAAGGGVRTDAFFSGLRLLIASNGAVAGAMGEAEGGGIYNSGSIVLQDSSVRDNRADSAGPANGGTARGGGIFNRDGTVSITRSTLSGNVVLGGAGTAGAGADAQGGGLANLFGTASLTNSTVSGNSVVGGTGSLSSGRAFGGGVLSLDGTTRLFHDTIVSNSVAPFGLDGGGLHASGGTVEIRNTILAANRSMFDVVSTNDNVFDSAGFNLLGTTTQPLTTVSSDQVNVTAAQLKLGPLQDNGGPTFTHALDCGSSARDAGGNAGAPPTDQRGFPRIVNGVVDVGSYEAAAGAAGALVVTKTCPPDAVRPGGVLVFSGTVTNSGGSALTNIVIFNDQPTVGTVITNFARLEPGEGRAFQGRYVVPSNFTACQITDTLTAQGTDLCGGSVVAQGSNSCAIAQQLSIVCPPDQILQCLSEIPAPDPLTVTVTSSAGPAPAQFAGEIRITNGCVIEIQRRYSATNACGDGVECTQTIRVEDTTMPVLSGVPADQTYPCPAQLPPPPSVTALDNCDGAVPVTFSATTNGMHPTVIVRMWTAQDHCTNRVSATQTITVNDTAGLVLLGVPTNRIFECLFEVPPPAIVTAQNNCQSNIVVTTTSTTNGSCPTIIIRCWQATDQNQNTVQACQTNVVQDTTPPVLSGVPADQTYSCPAQVPPPANVTALDNCDGAVPVIFSATTNGMHPTVIVRMWTAQDRCTNRVSATQTITVNDTAGLVLLGVPINRTFECLFEVPPPAVVTAQNNCQSNIVVTTTSTTNGSCPTIIIRCWQATDQNQNTVQACQTNVVQDTTPPVLSGVPANQTYSCPAQVPPPANVTALDNCDGAVPVIFSATTNGMHPTVIVRMWTAQDHCTNRVSATQTITINDTAGLVLLGVPTNRTFECLSEVPPPAVVTAQNNCQSNIVVTMTSTTNGSCPTIIIRCWQATDQNQNTVQACQTNVVQDTTPPVLSGVPANQTYACPAQVPPPANVTALDNCDGAVPVTFSATTNGMQPTVIVRMWTAQDQCTNRVSATQTITINDSAGLVLLGVPTNRTFECLFEVPPPAIVTAQNNCQSNIVVTMTSMTNGSCPTIIVRCWQATDQNQNTVQACQTNVVQDTTPPVLSGVPANQTYACPAQVPPPANVTALDNCDGAVPVIFSATTNGVHPTIIVRMWTAQDHCTNRVRAMQTITVNDTTGLVLLGVPTNRTFQCLGEVPPPALVSAQDNCDSDVVVTRTSTTNGMCPTIIIHCYQAVGRDQMVVMACQTNLVQDTIPPVLLNIPPNATFASVYDLPPAPDIRALDNCAGEVPVTCLIWTNNTCPTGVLSLNHCWLAADGCGNVSMLCQTNFVACPDGPVRCPEPYPFWKDNVSQWPLAYAPDQQLGTLFANASASVADQTLFEALVGTAGSGAVQELLRQGVTALLNAGTPGIAFAFTTNAAASVVDSALLDGGATAVSAATSSLQRANEERFCQPGPRPCVRVRTEVACLLPGDQCGSFSEQATGYKGLDNPGFCYSITVNNCGVIPLSNLAVFDDQLGDLSADFASPGGTLAVNQSVTRYYKMAWSATTTNRVSVGARGVGTGGIVVSDQDSAVAQVQNASVVCQLLVTSATDLDGIQDNQVQLPAQPGWQGVTYRVVLCNSGAVGLRGLMINAGLPSCPAVGPITLAPGECVTNDLCVRSFDCRQAPFSNLAKVTGFVDTGNAGCGRDIYGQPVRVKTQCTGLVECRGESNSGLVLTKSADQSTVGPGGLVTYTYTVRNTGAVTLTAIEVVDDNGTPDFDGDDVAVGSVPSLDAGFSAALKRTLRLPVTLCSSQSGQETGTLISEVLSNGNVRVMFIQSRTVNDNTYGANAVGWVAGGHKFRDLTGSDAAEFQFKNGAGQVILQFKQDYITANPNYPSGYGTLGVTAGDGRMVTGSAASILFVSTSLTENLNKAPFLNQLATYTVNSPAETDPNNGLWEDRMIYSVVVDRNAFGSSGFGGAMIVDQHNSPSKCGSFETVVCGNCVTNIARVVGQAGTLFLTNTAWAVVCAGSHPDPVPRCPQKCDFWKKNPGQWSGYQPQQPLVNVFSWASGYKDVMGRSLVEGVDGKAGSGKVRELLKQAVASLLNAQALGPQYPFTSQDLVQGVNMALANGKDEAVRALTDLLREANEDKNCR